jgi:micrococcal nuclease
LAAALLAALCAAAVPAPVAAQRSPTDGPAAPRGSTTRCVLTRISDGDTIECTPAGRVRLLGVDSPEGQQEPYGAAATAGLASLVPARAALDLELDMQARDRYGRLLAYVWLDGAMVNWLLVRRGWAVTLSYAPNRRYAPILAAAERQARAERRGLWGVDGFRCRPVEFRRRRCV